MAELPVAVVGLVHHDRRFVVIQRAHGVDDGGYWAPPSGKVEPRETDPDAVIREMEELGITVHPKREVWRCTSSNGRYQLRWWLCLAQHRSLRVDPTEVAATQWCTREEFLQLHPIFAGDQHFFAQVLPTLVPESFASIEPQSARFRA